MHIHEYPLQSRWNRYLEHGLSLSSELRLSQVVSLGNLTHLVLRIFALASVSLVKHVTFSYNVLKCDWYLCRASYILYL